jgi:ABC-type multidrug transport system permease subunit
MEMQIGNQQKNHYPNIVGFKKHMKLLVLFNGIEFCFATLLIALMLCLAELLRIVKIVVNLEVQMTVLC